jgi:hypothetical protein
MTAFTPQSSSGGDRDCSLAALGLEIVPLQTWAQSQLQQQIKQANQKHNNSDDDEDDDEEDDSDDGSEEASSDSSGWEDDEEGDESKLALPQEFYLRHNNPWTASLSPPLAALSTSDTIPVSVRSDGSDTHHSSAIDIPSSYNSHGEESHDVLDISELLKNVRLQQQAERPSGGSSFS